MSSKDNMQSLLIVDDQPENIALLSELLKDEYKIRVATNGEKALQVAFSDTPPDLILLDIVMPVMNGYQVCERLKADEHTSGIPVIFITSKQSDYDELLGFEAGAVDYITKPFNPVVIRARIRTHAELKRYRDQLEVYTYTDLLTDLPNRRRFDIELETAWAYAVRDQSCLSIMMIDVDYFKLYNDNYGHIAGDDILNRIATALKQSLKRKTDILCRYGGEEFVCILPRTSGTDALDIAEVMRMAVESLRLTHEFSIVSSYITISIGVASMRPKPENCSVELLQMADSSLYLSKDKGRNCITLSSRS